MTKKQIIFLIIFYGLVILGCFIWLLYWSANWGFQQCYQKYVVPTLDVSKVCK